MTETQKYPCRLRWKLEAQSGRWSCVFHTCTLELTPAPQVSEESWSLQIIDEHGGGSIVVANGTIIDGKAELKLLLDAEAKLAEYLEEERERLADMLDVLYRKRKA